MFFVEEFFDESMDDLLLEAYEDITYVLNELYPLVSKILDTSVGDKKFKQLVGKFLDRNSEKLHTPGPLYMIAFTDADKAEYFNLFQINQSLVKDVVNKIIKEIPNSEHSDFKLLRNNPTFFVFYCCIRYYTMKKDEKGLNAALAIYALATYPSVFSIFFKFDADPGIMQYTIDHLSKKFMLKKEDHIFGTLFTSISHSYHSLRPTIVECKDKNIVKFIQRIRNDQKSMIKKIWLYYKENYEKGLRTVINKDSYAEVNFDDKVQNKTSMVSAIAAKIMLKFINNGVDLKRAGYAAQMAQVSISDTRYFMTKIISEKYSDKILRFIESILFLYLYDNNKTKEDINSSNFLSFSNQVFRRTNSNDPNVKNIKDLLEEFSEDVGVHEKFKRLQSRVQYKRAIFLYFVLSIMYYNQD